MKEYKLQDLISIKNGKKYDHLNKGNIPVYGSGGIMTYVDDYLYDGEAVLLPRKGTLNNIMYSKGKLWTVDTMYYALVNEKAEPYYLYAYLSQLDLSALDSGSTLPSMTATTYYYIPVKLPNKETQQKIAQVLSTLDRKIALNQQINAELEKMAKTLYDYWFVQFDFPDENGNPYKSSGGEMVYNPELKRDVPKGWESGTLLDWIKNDKSGDWGKDIKEGNYIFKVDCIRGTDINGINGNGSVAMPTRFILQKNVNKLLTPYDLVIEISGGSPTQSTGRIAGITQNILNRFNNPLICSNFCKAISLKDKTYFFNFMYLWKFIYDIGILFGWEGKTSGIKNLLFDSFISKYRIINPPRASPIICVNTCF